ncbi:MAG: hypothetical protein NVS3B10_23610 [Polyangiales bacterium]
MQSHLDMMPMSLSYPRVRARARAHVPAKPLLTVILYGVTSEVAAECSLAAAEQGVARAEVKHLQAACSALKTHPRAMMIASLQIRPWDREVIEDHAVRAGAPLRWVSSDADAYDAAKAVTAWSSVELRRAKTLL